MVLIPTMQADGVDPTGVPQELPGAVFTLYPNFLSRELADFFFETLLLSPFEQGRVRGGLERRKSCFYSQLRAPDGSLVKYYYAGKENMPLEYPDELVELQALVSKHTGADYNSCLVNLYEDGKQTIGWHSDSEKSLVKNSAIASGSFGAERWFDVRAKDSAPDPDKELSIRMTHGSFMVMGNGMQDYYQHRVRPEAAVKTPRINVTFRLSR